MKTILCISDNDQTLAVQRYLCGARGYRTLVARDAESAVSLCWLGVSLVVGDGGADVNWPVLTQRLKRQNPRLPIVMTDEHQPVSANALMQQIGSLLTTPQIPELSRAASARWNHTAAS